MQIDDKVLFLINAKELGGLPENTKHLYNIYTTPAQRLRR